MSVRMLPLPDEISDLLRRIGDAERLLRDGKILRDGRRRRLSLHERQRVGDDIDRWTLRLAAARACHPLPPGCIWGPPAWAYPYPSAQQPAREPVQAYASANE